MTSCWQKYSSYVLRDKGLLQLKIKLCVIARCLSLVLIVERENFMLRSLDCHRYTRNMVEPNIAKPGFCSIQFTQTFAGKQTCVHRKIGNILKPTILKSEFHSIPPCYTLERFQTKCRKTKFKDGNPANQSQRTRTIQWTNQNSKANTGSAGRPVQARYDWYWFRMNHGASIF